LWCKVSISWLVAWVYVGYNGLWIGGMMCEVFVGMGFINLVSGLG
jgi:hypothetical protein